MSSCELWPHVMRLTDTLPGCHGDGVGIGPGLPGVPPETGCSGKEVLLMAEGTRARRS